jgi:cation diffusion facilitator family transporter
MHTSDLTPWRHDHAHGQDRVTLGERRTLVVALLTATFMVVEVAAGVTYGSMALLADGLHMASHALALGIAVLAYVYSRRLARDERFSFGTGKVNALGGFSGALLLALIAAVMAWESVMRLTHPVAIEFNQAIAVAVLGLVLNGISVAILGVHDRPGHDHPRAGHVGAQHEHHGHAHHDHVGHHDHDHDHDHGHGHDAEVREHVPSAADDHNLQAAYLHVLADALTSVTALIALLGGKYAGLSWLDPVMGVVGSALVARWSVGLLRQSSVVLLDHQAPGEVRSQLRTALEGGGDERVTDLHVWSIGPGVRAACITLVAGDPLPPERYKERIPASLGIRHATIELHRCPTAAHSGEVAVQNVP